MEAAAGSDAATGGLKIEAESCCVRQSLPIVLEISSGSFLPLRMAYICAKCENRHMSKEWHIGCKKVVTSVFPSEVFKI